LWDIQNNGPVTALMSVPLDFLCYEGGIYETNANDTDRIYPNVLQMYVNIVGFYGAQWRPDPVTGVWALSVDYWVGQSTFGDTWGCKGFFQIKGGLNLGLDDPTNYIGFAGPVASLIPVE